MSVKTTTKYKSIESFRSDNLLSIRLNNGVGIISNCTEDELVIKAKIGNTTIKIGTLGNKSRQSIVLNPYQTVNVYLDTSSPTVLESSIQLSATVHPFNLF